MDTAPQGPAPQSGVSSRITSPDRVQMRLDAMYAKEHPGDAILQAKQRHILAMTDQMRAEVDRACPEFQKH